jgi:hypothetical protein
MSGTRAPSVRRAFTLGDDAALLLDSLRTERAMTVVADEHERPSALRLERGQQIDRLAGQRHDVPLTHFHPLGGDRPRRLVEIDFGPSRCSRLGQAHGGERDELEAPRAGALDAARLRQ